MIVEGNVEISRQDLVNGMVSTFRETLEEMPDQQLKEFHRVTLRVGELVCILMNAGVDLNTHFRRTK